MPDIIYKVPYPDNPDTFRLYFQDEKGGFRNEYGTRWSPPIRRITKTWQKLPVFQVFGDTIIATKDQLEWRVQSRNQPVERVTAYYPGFTPVDRTEQKDFRLYIDLDSSRISGHTVKWWDQHGSYLFTADRRPAPGCRSTSCNHCIERLLETGAIIEQSIADHYISGLIISHEDIC